MSTLRVNNIQLNQEGNAAISIANSYNVVISVDGTEKIKLHQNGIDFSGGITINNVPVIDGSGELLTLPSPGTSGNVLVSNGTYWTSDLPLINVSTQVSGGVLSPINGGTGLSSPGTSGNVLVSTGTSWVSQELTTGPVYKAIAKGEIYDGNPVVINGDETVSEVVGSVPLQISSNGQIWTSSIYNTIDNNVIFLCLDNTSNLVAHIVTTSSNSVNNTITVGRSFKVSNANGAYSSSSYPAVTFDSDNNKVVVAFTTNFQSYVSVGLISGNTINFGSSVFFTNSLGTGLSGKKDIIYNKTEKKIVIFYPDTKNSSYATAIVGDISGNNVTFGTPVVFRSVSVQYISATYHEEQNRAVVAFDEASRAYIMAANVSGNTITFGTAIKPLGENNTTKTKLFYDSNYNRIFAYYLNSSEVSIRLLSLANTTFTFRQNASSSIGSAQISNGGDIAYDDDKKKLYYMHPERQAVVDPRGYQGNTRIFASTSNNNVYFTNIISVNSMDYPDYHNAIYDKGAKKVLLFYNSGLGTLTQLPKVQVINEDGRRTNLRPNNFIGIAAGNYANGQTATVQLIGSIDDAQSGLEPSLTYYVRANGSLSITREPDANGFTSNSTAPANADTALVTAGVALTPTKLLIKYS